GQVVNTVRRWTDRQRGEKIRRVSRGVRHLSGSSRLIKTPRTATCYQNNYQLRGIDCAFMQACYVRWPLLGPYCQCFKQEKVTTSPTSPTTPYIKNPTGGQTFTNPNA